MRKHYNYSSINPNLQIFLEGHSHRYERLDDQTHRHSLKEDFENYRLYYSGERFPSLLCRGFNRYRLFVIFVFLVACFIYINYKSPRIDPKEYLKPQGNVIDMSNQRTNPPDAMKQVGSSISCPDSPTPSDPDDVNTVRPQDIDFIGALGDSITIGSFSKNFKNEGHTAYFGNSFVTGADEKLDRHISIANILRELNPNLKGMSYGMNYGPNRGLNMGVGGRTSVDLPGQAQLLVETFNKSYTEDERLTKWKLFTIFIGTNDIRRLNCISSLPPVPVDVYKKSIEESIAIIKANFPKTIVILIGMWNSQLTIEATSLITTGNRSTCDNNSNVVEEREKLITSYKNATLSIQNERKFESKDFAVVNQLLFDDIWEPVRKSSGEYDKEFYADDLFHLSKYGNAQVAKAIWNNLLQPVGQKNRKANLSEEMPKLDCPDEKYPYIRTLGNSQQ